MKKKLLCSAGIICLVLEIVLFLIWVKGGTSDEKPIEVDTPVVEVTDNITPVKEEIVKGTFKKDIEWEISEDGTLTLTGAGVIEGY